MRETPGTFLALIGGVKRARYSLIFVVLMGLAACGRSQSETTYVNGKALRFTTNSCVWDGKTYAVGEKILGYDACNTCWCKEIAPGELDVVCTQMSCGAFF